LQAGGHRFDPGTLHPVDLGNLPWECAFAGNHHSDNYRRGGQYTMNAPASIAITPVFVADLSVEGERMPVYVHVIDHPDARVLVDTGMTELHPAMADMDPRLQPLSEQDFDLAGIDIVVNTHLHADHCGGNHLFAGKPIYVQSRELDDARIEDDYTIREWVEAPGVQYVPVDGEHELLPGLRLVPAPGHTPGMQMVVVETGGRPVIVGGDVAVWFGEFDEPPTEGRQRVIALDPELVWLAHEHEPWRPAPSKASRQALSGPPGVPRHHSRLLRQTPRTVGRRPCESDTRALLPELNGTVSDLSRFADPSALASSVCSSDSPQRRSPPSASSR
jgi:N-acyl homoserine lactone hydrolase